MAKYIVKKGDTLYRIAQDNGVTVEELAGWNDIGDPDFIVVGQVIETSKPSSTSPAASSKKRAIIKAFGLQSNTDRTVYASWTWNESDTEEYQVKWHYYTGDNIWFVGSDETVKVKQSLYTAPANATQVKFTVKPIAKSKSSYGSSSAGWQADWSTTEIYSFRSNPPATPSKPTVSFDKATRMLTARLDNITYEDLNANKIRFLVRRVSDYSIYSNSGYIDINQVGSAVYTCTLAPGDKYRVSCQAYNTRNKDAGSWSEYSEEIATMPKAPKCITECRASSETSVYIAWEKSDTATSYELEYTTKKENFDKSDQTTKVSSIEFTKYDKSGLTSGEKYYFRVRAVNGSGESSWTSPVEVVVGKKPAAPTTWSSTTTAVIGEPLNLYWVHNSQDNSSETRAELEIFVNGVKETTPIISKSTDEEEKDKTSVYAIDTSKYSEGAEIIWRVRTSGVTNEFGDWSIQRLIDIYSNPAFEYFRATDTNSNDVETLTSFPLYISALATPNDDIQRPIGYHLTITSKDAYETVDQVGNTRHVSVNEQIYSKYIDESWINNIELSAGDIDLVNNASYIVTCTASMSSGLTVDSSIEFSVAWSVEEYEPNAEIAFDEDTYTCMIRPYCMRTIYNDDGTSEDVLVENLSLSVYRREYDGKFTELYTDLDNSQQTTVTDPHPALDYARYRVVARSNETGAVGFFDVPGVRTGVAAVIIQWADNWSVFDVRSEDPAEIPAWTGSLLKLSYNINITNNSSPDVALVEYIGREHPVGYYGTQVGESATWSVSIDKNDVDTIYALRRLSKWMGDVYVREPSGAGYWANVTVAFTQDHSDVTIPVTLNVTRVEGGI